MQRHFSNRGEAHAERVAARMAARRQPTAKPERYAQPRQKAPKEWQRQPSASSPIEPHTSTEP